MCLTHCWSTQVMTSWKKKLKFSFKLFFSNALTNAVATRRISSRGEARFAIFFQRPKPRPRCIERGKFYTSIWPTSPEMLSEGLSHRREHASALTHAFSHLLFLVWNRVLYRHLTREKRKGKESEVPISTTNGINMRLEKKILSLRLRRE